MRKRGLLPNLNPNDFGVCVCVCVFERKYAFPTVCQTLTVIRVIRRNSLNPNGWLSGS